MKTLGSSILFAEGQLARAAESVQRNADSLKALHTLFKAIEEPAAMSEAIEALAKVLLQFDLCLVHISALAQARRIVAGTDDDEGLSNDRLNLLLASLDAAMKGSAY